MRRPVAAALQGMGARTRAGGSGCQPTDATGLQARAVAMAGCDGDGNGRVHSGEGIEANAVIEDGAAVSRTSFVPGCVLLPEGEGWRARLC